MSNLGDRRENLFGPHDSFKTVRATVRHWTNPDLVENVEGPGGRRKPSAKDGSTSRIREKTLLIWISRPDRIRIEERRQVDGRTETSLSVVDEKQWINRDFEGHVEIGDVETTQAGRKVGVALTDAERHFDPDLIRKIIGNLTLESLGLVWTAGRECVRVRGVRRSGGLLWSHWLPSEADEFEFHLDREKGVFLVINSKHAGRLFEVNEVLDVDFDQPFEDKLFTYTPEIGEQIHPPVPVTVRLTLESAAASMPFTVLVPTWHPDADHTLMEVFHCPARRSGREYLTLMYHSELSKSLWLHESAVAAPDHGSYVWEEFEQQGQKLSISDPGDDGMRIVAMQRDGTHVDIWSNHERTCLIDIALSLRPVSGISDSAGGMRRPH
jgi:hypothetical protein